MPTRTRAWHTSRRRLFGNPSFGNHPSLSLRDLYRLRSVAAGDRARWSRPRRGEGTGGEATSQCVRIKRFALAASIAFEDVGHQLLKLVGIARR